MTYAIRTDLVDRYGEAEVAQRESMLPVGAVDRALADASAEVDSYVSARYAVPLVPLPAHVLRIVCIIGRYYLLGDAVSEESREDVRMARAQLREVRDGRAQLEGVAPLVGAQSAATSSVVVGRDKVFGGGLR